MTLLAVVKPHVSSLEIVGRIAFAVLLGGAIGPERELTGQPAGLRTHITVALGAALFGVISVHGFDAYVAARNDNNYQIDVTRVASQVVVGVGFLGAGAILKEGASIHGLTTAASLWVTSAIGLALGIGSFLAAAITTIILLLSLVGLRGPRRTLRRRFGTAKEFVVIRLRDVRAAGDVVTAIANLADVEVRSVNINGQSTPPVIEVFLRHRTGEDLSVVLAPIATREDVTAVEVG